MNQLARPLVQDAVHNVVIGADHRSRRAVGSRGPVALHGLLMPYRALALGVIVINVAVLAHHVRRGDWRIADGSALSTLSALTLVNVAAAVLVRQQMLLDVLYRLAGRGSTAWPLVVRRSLSKVHHVGGLHVGFAVSGTAWLGAFAGTAVTARLRDPRSVSGLTVILAIALAVLLVTIAVAASPSVRARHHDVFEQSHRWGGWTAIALFWVLTVHLAVSGRAEANPIGSLVSDWHVWVVTIVTASVAWPWLHLRRVPITVHRPSDHVAIAHIDDGVPPAFSSAVGISLRPLHEWHAFATVTTPDRPGFRLFISRAGDWTGRFIDDPPTHVWLRGRPVVAPMAKAALLYERVVYVVTGSGIGPCLGQLLADRVPSRLVWSTRDPRATYGDALVDELAAAQPDAVVWDTSLRGQPDLLALALDAFEGFDAEAVFVVSNRSTTLRLVDDLERRGIPTFGPIWDS